MDSGVLCTSTDLGAEFWIVLGLPMYGEGIFRGLAITSILLSRLEGGGIQQPC